jgi:hypothetical protein
MKKLLSISAIVAVVLGMAGCKKDSDFLNVQPTTFLTTDQVFSDPNLALTVLADLYNRQEDITSLDGTSADAGWRTFADFSESFPSENGSSFIVQRTGWPYNQWSIDWFTAYTYIREVNLFLERDSASTQLAEEERKRFYAEGRFLRAMYYFELVKRYGGVPLILHSLTLPSKDITTIQFPRAKESDIYDFVISEAEALKGDLPADPATKSRASRAAAVAMECRAALYAASIAKYGATTPAVSLPGGEVGIPVSKATDYYTKALNAAKEIMAGTDGTYGLYNNGGNLSDNYANLFLDKASIESIYFEDFKTGGKVHGFTTNDQPYSLSDEGGDAGRLDPSLNLVEQYEKLDNTFAPLATVDGGNNPIYYTNLQDIFAERDARLAGTVLLPDGLYKGKKVDIWAGYVLADGSIVTSDEAGHTKPLPGTSTPVQVVGTDGPINGLEFRTQSGFYIRKYIDPAVGSGRRGQGSTVAFIRYRYAEVLLNAAEASFELGHPDDAAKYMNLVRARAGLATPLVAADITFDRVVHERRIELAFEGHILFDMKRWRLAHKVWDGTPTSATDLKTNLGVAGTHSTQPWGLWPYKVYNPTDPTTNGKWIFKETRPALATGYNKFQFGNYYSQISNDAIAANPKLIRQPNQ